MIKIIGQHITQFGELWDKSLQDLLFEAMEGAIQNAGVDPGEIEAVFVGNMAGGSFEGQRHLNALASSWFATQTHNKYFPPAFRIEAACASGSMAVLAAEHALLARAYKTVLVVGVEKMTDVSGGKTTEILASAAHFQSEYGSTFPALYALLAKAHMQKFGTTREQLSSVAVKNHLHAMQNSHAQFHKNFSDDQISHSTLVADPLRILDCSPISDGAAAIVLTTKKSSKYLARIIGAGHAQDSLALAGRKNLTEIKSTKIAAQKAYAMAGVNAQEINFAEVHDCFTIAEILAIEDLGFFAKGNGGAATLEGKTSWESYESKKTSLVVNPSGGLKACGHPVGATGVKQLAYLANLLSKNRGRKALAHNVGGSGATVGVHVMG